MEKTDKSDEEILIEKLFEAIDNAAHQLSEYKTTIKMLIPLAERGMLKELNHTHQYIIDRAKKLIEK